MQEWQSISYFYIVTINFTNNVYKKILLGIFQQEKKETTGNKCRLSIKITNKHPHTFNELSPNITNFYTKNV